MRCPVSESVRELQERRVNLMVTARKRLLYLIIGYAFGPRNTRTAIILRRSYAWFKELRENSLGESSAEIRAAWNALASSSRCAAFYNARMPARLIRKHCALNDAGERTLEMAVRRLSLSARAHDRILKVARTVADLDDSAPRPPSTSRKQSSNRSLDCNYWS